MGQWGAYGQAKRGVPVKKILAHYYRGTKLVETRTTSVRVLLAEGRRDVTVGSDALPRHGRHGEIHELEPGSYSTTAWLQGGNRSRSCRRTRCRAH